MKEFRPTNYFKMVAAEKLAEVMELQTRGVAEDILRDCGLSWPAAASIVSMFIGREGRVCKMTPGEKAKLIGAIYKEIEKWA